MTNTGTELNPFLFLQFKNNVYEVTLTFIKGFLRPISFSMYGLILSVSRPWANSERKWTQMVKILENFNTHYFINSFIAGKHGITSEIFSTSSSTLIVEYKTQSDFSVSCPCKDSFVGFHIPLTVFWIPMFTIQIPLTRLYVVSPYWLAGFPRLILSWIGFWFFLNTFTDSIGWIPESLDWFWVSLIRFQNPLTGFCIPFITF